MKNLVKQFVIIINLIIMILAIYWYFEKNEIEPLTVIGGQLSTILLLFFEDKITNKFIAKKIVETEITVKNNSNSNSNIKLNEIKNSKISIDNV